MCGLIGRLTRRFDLVLHQWTERQRQWCRASVTPVCCFCAAQLGKCSQDLSTNTKAVTSAIAQLLSEATQGDENYAGGSNRTRLTRCSSGCSGVCAAHHYGFSLFFSLRSFLTKFSVIAYRTGELVDWLSDRKISIPLSTFKQLTSDCNIAYN